LRKHLVPALGHIALANLTGEPLQKFVSKCNLSPKTIKNLVATLRIMWITAKAWNLIEHDPFKGLKLPEQNNTEGARCFTADEMRQVIEAAEEPYRTLYWIAAETGIRMGELCGLKWESIDFDRTIVQIRHASWRSKVGTPKSKKGVRTFALSPRLCAALREKHSIDRPTDQGLVFHTKHGNPWDGDTIRKRKLHPLLERLGIRTGGFHAFRHGNATLMDQTSVPTKVRQDRLGHVDFQTTLGYTHVVSLDDQRAAAELERVIFGNVQKTPEQRPTLNISWQIAGGNA
jgi:integrase